MKQYSRIAALWMSFYSPALYRDVARNWGGIGFSYLLLLAVLICLPLIIGLGALFDHAMFGKNMQGVTAMESVAYHIAGQVPPMKWTDGKLSVQAKQPYSITDDTLDLRVVIDTTGKVTSLDKGVWALVTRDYIMVRKREDVTEVYNFSEIGKEEGKEKTWDGNAVFNADMARNGVKIVSDWLQAHRTSIMVIAGAVTYLFMIFGFFLYRMIVALIYGAVGVIFARILRADIIYQTSVRLACVAITPVVVVDMVSTLAGGWNIPWLAMVALGLCYVFFAIYSVRVQKTA